MLLYTRIIPVRKVMSTERESIHQWSLVLAAKGQTFAMYNYTRNGTQCVVRKARPQRDKWVLNGERFSLVKMFWIFLILLQVKLRCLAQFVKFRLYADCKLQGQCTMIARAGRYIKESNMLFQKC